MLLSFVTVVSESAAMNHTEQIFVRISLLLSRILQLLTGTPLNRYYETKHAVFRHARICLFLLAQNISTDLFVQEDKKEFNCLGL